MGSTLERRRGPDLGRGVLRWVVVEWGRSSSEEGDLRTSLDTQPPDSGMEMGRGASSIQDSDQVEQALGVQEATPVADAYMGNHDRWPPSYWELDYPVRTPLVREQGNGSLAVTDTSAHKSDDCSAVA